MLVLIALIIAAYGITRLIQIPCEHFDASTPSKQLRKVQGLTLISILGCLVIGWLVVQLMEMSSRPDPSPMRLVK